MKHRYIVVWADYQSSGISERYGGKRLSQTDIELNDDALWKRIQKWVCDYQPYIPMEVRERLQRYPEIKFLDEQGLSLAQELKERLGAGVKVSYYSEGVMGWARNIADIDSLYRQMKDKYGS